MAYFTSNTYTLKRKILSFTNKIPRHLSKPEKKFTADITYGIPASYLHQVKSEFLGIVRDGSGSTATN